MAPKMIELDANTWAKIRRQATASGTTPQRYLEELLQNKPSNVIEKETDALVSQSLAQLGIIDSGLEL